MSCSQDEHTQSNYENWHKCIATTKPYTYQATYRYCIEIPDTTPEETAPPSSGGGGGNDPNEVVYNPLPLQPCVRGLENDLDDLGNCITVMDVAVSEIASCVGDLTANQISFLRSTESTYQIQNFLDSNICGQETKIFTKSVITDLMLNKKVDLEESFASPFNVDLELVKPSDTNPEPEKVLFMCIYNKLLKNPQFKELFKNVFGDNERLNVKFEFAIDLETTTGARTQVISHLVSNGNVIGINQTIKLNKDWYGARSDIKIAQSILHECIHAYLNVKQTECEESTTLTQINAWKLDDLINKIYTENKSCIFSNEPANQDDHHFMFNNLVPNMANIISQLKDDLISQQHQLQAEGNTYYNDETNLPENFDWNDLFKYLAMDGLNKTNTFKENIENNVLENTKYGFYSSNNAEGVTKNNCND